MRQFFSGLLLLVTAILSGCATPPQPPVALSQGYFSTSQGKIGVVMSDLPKADTNFPGAGCLLCLATASALSSKMTLAVKTWSNQELATLKKEVAAVLTAKGQSVVIIDQPVNVAALPDRDKSAVGFARKDFSSFKAQSGVDRLVVIDITAMGAWRNFASYVPTGAPYAVVNGNFSLIDLTSHKLELFEALNVQVTADGEWDEPPNFPGLTNAYFQAIEKSKDTVKAALKK